MIGLRLIYICSLQSLPGPPFVFGSFLVVIALLVAFFIPEGPLGTHIKMNVRRSSDQLEIPVDGSVGPTSIPLMHPMTEEDIAAL